MLEKDKPLTQENLLDALKNGHAFVGFDVSATRTDFHLRRKTARKQKFKATKSLWQSGVKLKATAPQNARFVIFKNGEKFSKRAKIRKSFFDAKETGTYRVEVYLDALGSPFDKMPWIISNPIYVK